MSNQASIKSTKQLAWKLGLVKKRSKSSNDQASKRLRKNFQPYAYLIIMDFESTCWEDKKYRTQEIIEFPAVLLNTGNGEIEEEFHYYVQPMENPILSEFCQTLTGITQAQVEEGIPIMNCLKRFTNWLNKLKQTKGITFGQPTGSRLDSTLCTFVTWSDWDLGVCLQYECRRKQLLKPQELNSWIDLRATYRKFYERKPEGLNGALKDLGIDFEGREHSGLHDSRNTARLAWRMMCDGCLLNVTKTLPQTSGARMPPMSAGIGKITAKGQNPADKPVTILAKPQLRENAASSNSAASTAAASTLADNHTTANLESLQSKNTKFTNIKPTSVSPISESNPVTKASVTHCTANPQTLEGSASNRNSTSETVSTNATASCQLPTAPPATKVSLSIGLRKVATTSPQAPVQNYKTGSDERNAIGTPLFNRNSSLINNVSNMGSGRPSLGASPLLRSDGMSYNMKLRTPAANVGFQRAKVPSGEITSKFGKENTYTGIQARNSTPGNNKSSSNLNNSNSTMSPQDCKPSTSKPQTSPDLFKIPTPPAPGRRSSDLSLKQNACFKVPTPPASGNMTWRSSGLSNRTPVTQNLSNGNISMSSDMHRTPPLCECGRRTKRRIVQSPGANQGRAFFSCPLGRGTASTGNLQKKSKCGCKYFKWESPSLGNQSLNSSANSFINHTRNSMNNLTNTSWNCSNAGNLNRSVSWSGFNGSSYNYSNVSPAWSPPEQFLGRPPCPNIKMKSNMHSFRSPDIIAISPPRQTSPDLLNDSISSLDQFPLLPPDAFSDPDKT